MADGTADRRAVGTIERHVQTVMISIITGSIVFAAAYMFNDRSDKAVLTTQLTNLNAQVAELRAEIRAMQSNFVTKDVSADHEQRIRALERRVLSR